MSPEGWGWQLGSERSCSAEVVPTCPPGERRAGGAGGALACRSARAALQNTPVIFRLFSQNIELIPSGFFVFVFFSSRDNLFSGNTMGNINEYISIPNSESVLSSPGSN